MRPVFYITLLQNTLQIKNCRKDRKNTYTRRTAYLKKLILAFGFKKIWVFPEPHIPSVFSEQPGNGPYAALVEPHPRPYISIIQFNINLQSINKTSEFRHANITTHMHAHTHTQI